MKALAALFLVVAVGVQGCAAGRACSDVGDFNGVGVEIPRALFVESGSVAIDVCDTDGCASAVQRLGPVPEGPVGRAANVSFDDLGRHFEPGQVTVTVKVASSDGQLVAAARHEIELMRSYPNGMSCDGDGYVNGSLRLNARDRV
ncbi:hypothetical protein [Nocardioides sp. cx-173]|uniref:hypothetical protein n=1 Tax=Nocardioides sp. cx-173 TaxID=2898796 RepID=UPI001E36A78C|nr:hypothetical protein [Nocardioides sp. cx-173]MCD4526876.1 hypothetical protein [Nocardioides sp. cx-173]UGB41335.1 hypothetical protein LQ940_18435 [Nocardioides sp. cx-173]